MSDDSSWSEWFLHDGKGCPCVGQMVWVAYDNLPDAEFIAGTRQCFGSVVVGVYEGGHPCRWTWDSLPTSRIIRFRIKKPRALLDLIQLIADLPAPVKTRILAQLSAEWQPVNDEFARIIGATRDNISASLRDMRDAGRVEYLRMSGNKKSLWRLKP